jgi:hypothetical protein
MGSQDQDRQDVERIMRRAEELGHDPARVARALTPVPPKDGADDPGAEAPELHLAQRDPASEDVPRRG